MCWPVYLEFLPYSIIKKAVGSNGNNRQISRVPKLNVRVEPDNWTTSTLNEVYNGAQIIRYNPFIIETSIIITIWVQNRISRRTLRAIIGNLPTQGHFQYTNFKVNSNQRYFERNAYITYRDRLLRPVVYGCLRGKLWIHIWFYIHWYFWFSPE